MPKFKVARRDGKNAGRKKGKNKNDNPLVEKNGTVCKQLLWNSMRASVQKFGATGRATCFALFMELPEMHARIYLTPLCDAVLDDDDNCAQEWFNSEKDMRWELPGSVELDETCHGTKCSKCSRTKQIYDAEWDKQHHQAYDVDVNPEKQPQCRKHETLCRNCWNKANRRYQNCWLLNSRLSRQEAFHGAYELGKKCLKSAKDYNQLMETTLEQAKTA